MKPSHIDVYYHDRLVGRIVSDAADRCLFSYASSWIKEGFSISPRSLPLNENVFSADPIRFDGIFGVFHDSLPDGWGTLTAIKALRKRGISYMALSPMERLCYLGEDGLGGLSYRPNYADEPKVVAEDYDAIALSMVALAEDEDVDFDALFALAGSTGGARPKAHMRLHDEEWIIKFRQKNDPPWMGKMEYEYALTAKEAGIDVPEVMLLPSSLCDGYFACKRFDRVNGKRVHVLSLSGLLEMPHDQPFLDYVTFLQATKFITKSEEQVWNAFALAAFNVFAKNRDDHGKNFAYLYDESRQRYVLSPAYDLTFVPQQTAHEMTVAGDEEPSVESLRNLYRALHLSASKAEAIIERVESVVHSHLGHWLAKD